MEDPNSIEAWGMARFGFAVDELVQREINKPTAIQNSGGYGVGEDGRMYMLGQPAQSATAPRQPVNMTFLLLVLAGVYLATQG